MSFIQLLARLEKKEIIDSGKTVEDIHGNYGVIMSSSFQFYFEEFAKSPTRRVTALLITNDEAKGLFYE